MPETLLRLSQSAVEEDVLATRSLLQDWMARQPLWVRVPKPNTSDARTLAVAASIVELMAERSGQPAPPWTREVAPLPEPLYLVRSALTMPRLRELCLRDGPAPMRRRHILAPPGYLSFA